MIRPIACLLALSAATAAELAVRDIHLGVASRPGDFDYELTSSTGRVSGADTFDAGASLELGARWSFSGTGDSVGLIAGADLAIDRLDYDGGDGLSVMWGKVAGGLAWALHDRVTLSGEVLAGYGLSSLTLPGSSTAPAFSADGSGTAYEARLGAIYQLTRKVGLGLSAGWQVAAHDLSGDGVDVTLEQSGWYLAFQVAWRMDDAPPALE
ncbi:MAG TPA: hypothetical protein DCS97_04960 [Planctomycetes bacterium]|nr:hypothetical protein [Planctomycetota bacterium]